MPFELVAHGYSRCLACDVSPIAVEEMLSKKAERMASSQGEASVDQVEFTALDVLSPLPSAHLNSFNGVVDKVRIERTGFSLPTPPALLTP